MFIGLLKQFLKKTVTLVASVGTLVFMSSAGTGTLLFVGSLATSFDVNATTLTITDASWSSRRDRLTVSGRSDDRANVTVTNADTGASVGDDSDRRGRWSVQVNYRENNLVPCRVRAIQPGGGSRDVAERNVSNAPANCDHGGVINLPPICSIDSPASNVTIIEGNSVNYSSTSSDPNGDTLSSSWSFQGGSPSSSNNEDPGSVTYNSQGNFNTTLTVSDGNGGSCTDSRTITVDSVSVGPQCSDGVDNDNDGLIDFPADPGCTSANDNDEFNAPPPPVAQCNDGIDNDGDGLVDMADPGCSSPGDNDETNLPPAPIPNVSINSTSANGFPGGTAVTEQPFTNQAGYAVLSINDLGMHCGDFDTRISSILPPFNVTHTHVIQKGSNPAIMTPVDGVEVVYSASSNPTDPILTGINSAGTGPVYSSMLADGSVYKTNFWDVARQAYDPFYPSGILPLFYDPLASIVDLGLPMPNVERFYIDQPGFLSAEQQEMPGMAAPYVLNDPMTSKTFTTNQPFFTTFPFGYTSRNVDWFEQAGIPMTAFDDFGRENPWALMRVQAKAGGNVLASLDTVLPISGEANCGFCHGDPADGGNGAAIQALLDANIAVASSLDDPEFGNVPLEVSKEYAADLNLVRLHDLEHGTTLEADTPVVCQTCHYTPALDLAQLGPLGPENDASVTLNGGTLTIASLANGRDQIKHKSMSNVMHSHHGQVTDTNGNALFPAMPPAIDANGNLRDATLARGILEETCYQCHPGRRTDCLRGAMANGGMLCQDCHGDMAQVGNDFTHNVTLATPGAFDLGPDFYTNANTPRVPWANEPGCGSCHTGDVNNNMTATANTVDSPDGIRLMQAYKTGDAKATPIVPTNKRFAENVITAADNPNDAAAIGNPMLYRVSKGHGGVMCEGCHGATHGIWPNKNPAANDNVAAMQLQGHTGTISECTVCHGTAMDNNNTIDGPHGMHPIGDNTSFARGGHERVNRNGCSDCHGPGSRSSNQGTVLSAAKADRNLRGTLVRAGEPVGCTVCH